MQTKELISPNPADYKHLNINRTTKIVLSVLLVLLVLEKIFNLDGFNYNLDLDVYRLGAQRVLDGQELYDGAFHITEDIYLPFTYPPISALLFTPLALVHLNVSAVLLTCATVGVTWWMLAYTLNSAARLNRMSAGWISVALTAVFIYLSPINTTIGYGQINVLLMGIVFVDMLVVPRRYRGLLTGAAVAIKLTPAVFGLWFLLRKDWGSILRMGAATIGATAIGWLILPQDSLKYWTHTLIETGRIGSSAYALNQSINGLLYRSGLRTDESSGLLWVVLVCLALAVIAFIMHNLLKAQAPIAALCVNSLFALLASPVSWSHHWTWAPILLVALASYATANRAFPLANPRWLSITLVTLGFIAFAYEPYAFVPFDNDTEYHWNTWQIIVANSYMWWTILALIVMTIRFALPHGKTQEDAEMSATSTT